MHHSQHTLSLALAQQQQLINGQRPAQQQQQQQQREPLPISSTSKPSLTKVQNYVIASRIARQQEEMDRARALQELQQQKPLNQRPPLPPAPMPLAQQTVVRKQRVITPEMVARRPVEVKHNIMMRSRHKNRGDSVSSSVVSDSTEHIQNTKKASSQRKRGMEQSENAGDTANIHVKMNSNTYGSNSPYGKQETLTKLVPALSVKKDDDSKTFEELPSSLTTEEIRSAPSTKSDGSKDSLVTEAEIIHINSEPSNGDIPHLTVNTELQSAQSSSVKVKEDIETELSLIAALAQDTIEVGGPSPIEVGPTPIITYAMVDDAHNMSIPLGAQSVQDTPKSNVSGTLKNRIMKLSRKASTNKKSIEMEVSYLKVDDEKNITLSKDEVSTSSMKTPEFEQHKITKLVADLESKLEALKSKLKTGKIDDEKMSEASDGAQEVSEASLVSESEGNSEDNAKSRDASSSDIALNEYNQSDSESIATEVVSHGNAKTPGSPAPVSLNSGRASMQRGRVAAEYSDGAMGRMQAQNKMALPRGSYLLGSKSKVIEEEREYALEKEEEYCEELARVEPPQHKRREEGSSEGDSSSAMKSTLSNAERISVESSITNDLSAFVHKKHKNGVLQRAFGGKKTGRILLQRTRSKEKEAKEKEEEELMKSIKQGMTVARADNRKKESYTYNAMPIQSDCTPDTDELCKINNNWVNSDPNIDEIVVVKKRSVKDDYDMRYNDLELGGDSMYEDDTDFVIKNIMSPTNKRSKMQDMGSQTKTKDDPYPVIRNLSPGRQVSFSSVVTENATQTSPDGHYTTTNVAPTSPVEACEEVVDDDIFVIQSPIPVTTRNQIGSLAHLMESFALCGAKACMGSGKAMLSCVESCNDEPPKTVDGYSSRQYAVPDHLQRTMSPPLDPRCRILPSSIKPSSYSKNKSEHGPNAEQDMAGIFTRAFAIALDKTNTVGDDESLAQKLPATSTNYNLEKQMLKEQDMLTLKRRGNQNMNKPDDFMSVDGKFVPRKYRNDYSKDVPNKIAVKPKTRRRAVEIDEEIQDHEEDEPGPSSDQIDEMRELTRTNSLKRNSSSGSKGKTRGVRKFFNKLSRLRVGFVYEV
jgi:hypothetical protein